MAITVDHTSTGTSAAPWPHGGSASPSGVLLLIAYENSGDVVTGATYGGEALARLTSVVKAALEACRLWVYFLGSGVPAGAQNVAITVSTGTVTGYCITLNGASDLASNGTDSDINSDSLENPSGSIALSSITSFVAQVIFSGQANTDNITPPAGWSTVAETDHGLATSAGYYYDTIGSADVTYGWTQTAEDAVAIAVAIKESGVGATPINATLADASATTDGIGGIKVLRARLEKF